MIDLHTHSRYSDGSDSPTDIIRLAHQAGCSYVALTDHDRLDGIKEAADEASKIGIGFIPGVEISCIFDNGTLHLLAYFLNPTDGPLQDRLTGMQEARTKRNLEMAEKLQQNGIPITWEELMEEAGGPNLGRPHFAAVMVRKGIVPSIQEAFDTYLAKGKPFYVPKVQITTPEAIRLTKESGAVPVIAHPSTLGLTPTKLESYLREMKAFGLAGVESYYARYTRQERAGMASIAESVGLVATGGSDYHGSYKVGLNIGTGEGDLNVPDSVVEQLKSRII